MPLIRFILSIASVILALIAITFKVQASVADASSLSSWAEYGVSPGVLVGVIVIGGGIGVKGIMDYSKSLLDWHTEQMNSMRDAHAKERESLYKALLDKKVE